MVFRDPVRIGEIYVVLENSVARLVVDFAS